MKIIHTSDWHLGARLHEEDRVDEHRAFLDWLVALMRAEKPDAVVVAGDVFDVKAPSPGAQHLYYGFLARVVQEHLCQKVVVVAGNHDSASFLAAPSRLLEELGVVVVARAEGGKDIRKEVVVLRDEAGKPALVIAAVPFMYDAELANFGAGKEAEEMPREARIAAGWAAHYGEVIAAAKETAPGVPLVVTGHCTLKDARLSDAESERCRRVGGIEAYEAAPLAAGDYVALGHLHVPQAVKGYEGKMFYAGSPLRMSFDEARGTKGVNVVTFGAAGGACTVRRVAVPETVPIETIVGTPDAVKARVAELACDKAKKRFLRLQLKDFAGEARGHWLAFRALLAEGASLILEENDLRPAANGVAGLRQFAGKGIQQLRPREVAEQKLRSSGERWSEEQIAEFMKMYNEVVGTLAI